MVDALTDEAGACVKTREHTHKHKQTYPDEKQCESCGAEFLKATDVCVRNLYNLCSSYKPVCDT